MARNYGTPRVPGESRPSTDRPGDDGWYDRWISSIADHFASHMAGEDEREARIRDLRDRFDRMLHRLLERRVEYRDFGPRDDVQPDGRIYEEVTERLTTDPRLDATDIAVSVAEGIVTLDGTVKNRAEKRLAEDCVDTVSGVRDVNNNLRIREEQARHDTGEPREGMGGHRTAI